MRGLFCGDMWSSLIYLNQLRNLRHNPLAVLHLSVVTLHIGIRSNTVLLIPFPLPGNVCSFSKLVYLFDLSHKVIFLKKPIVGIIFVFYFLCYCCNLIYVSILQSFFIIKNFIPFAQRLWYFKSGVSNDVTVSGSYSVSKGQRLGRVIGSVFAWSGVPGSGIAEASANKISMQLIIYLKLSNGIVLWVPRREWEGAHTKKVVRIRCTKRCERWTECQEII